MWVSVTTPHAYLPHIFKLSNNNMYDTLIDITLLSTKIMHPTRCNKEAQVICDVGCIPRIPHVVKMSTTTQILK